MTNNYRKIYEGIRAGHKEQCDALKKEWIEAITKNVCKYFEQSYEKVIGKDRYAEYIIPRHVTYYLGLTYLNDVMTASFIGPRFGKKVKHCNVIYGKHKIVAKMRRNEQFKEKIETLISILKKENLL